MNVYLKYCITAGIVVLVSEVAKRSDRMGSLIAALPLVTILTMVWLHVERQSTDVIANHAYYTFWYVLPSLPMFLACLGAGCCYWFTQFYAAFFFAEVMWV